jgi:phosphoribosyl-AMP cyclohydrolase
LNQNLTIVRENAQGNKAGTYAFMRDMVEAMEKLYEWARALPDFERGVRAVTDIGILFEKAPLVPVIVQDDADGTVLMLAHMNREALEKTLETGRTWFYSRSKERLWNKGETSGHFQNVRSIHYDCDADALLVKAEQVGVACHTGERSCFYREL